MDNHFFLSCLLHSIMFHTLSLLCTSYFSRNFFGWHTTFSRDFPMKTSTFSNDFTKQKEHIILMHPCKNYSSIKIGLVHAHEPFFSKILQRISSPSTRSISICTSCVYQLSKEALCTLNLYALCQKGSLL